MSLPAMGNVTSGGDIDVISGEGGAAEYVEPACTERLSEVEWARAAILASFLVLGFINVMVIAGNTLVIAAVFLSSKLRTVTNLFIVSLAVSDLLVGICVLPFSTSYEVLGVWIFGDIWCQMWLAVDVWMCTASILNLCAISLDRYVAVTRPVSYPSIMSSRRAKILIAIVWSLSFVICLPPLVGWNDTSGTASGNPSAALPVVTNNTAAALQGLLDDGDEVGAATGRSTRSLLASYRSDNDIFESIDVDFGDYDDRTGTGNRNALNVSDLANGLGVVRRVMAAVLSVRDEGAAGSDGDVPDWTSVLLANLSETTSANDSARSDVVTSTSGGEMTGSGSGGSYGRANMNATSQAACTCLLISDKGYRIYSALGSFYLPMLVMMFFYWKIYRAAVETTRAINQGYRTTKLMGSGGGSGIGGRFDEQRLTLRIHRGRSSTDLYGNGSCSGADFRSSHHHHRRRGAVRNSSLKDKWSAAAGRAGHRCISGMTFPPSSDANSGAATQKPRSLHNANHSSGAPSGSSAPHSRRRAATRQNHWTSVQCRTTAEGTTLPVTSTYAAVTTAAAADALGPPPNSASSLEHSPCDGATGQRFEFIPLNEQPVAREGENGGDVTVATTSQQKPSTSQQRDKHPPRDDHQQQKQNGGGTSANNGGDGGCATVSERGPQIFAKMGKRNIKAQVKRFRTETKAAKTLGIIVGGFILCWLPFFTTYLVGAFCAEDCVPESLFAVFFWLGYCNSAINPCVYAFFSRDFRHAFKRILCRCFMRREHSVKERLATMLPASLQLASFFEESEDGSNSH